MHQLTKNHAAITKHTVQQGSILIVSLLILLVLTVIGVTALNDSVLEEKMSSNFQKGFTAFQAAESAINLTYIEISQDDGRYIDATTAANNDTPPQPTALSMERSSEGANSNTKADVSMTTTVNFLERTADTKTAEGASININDSYPGEVYEIVATGTVDGTNVSRTHIQGVHRRLPKDGAVWD